LAGSAFSGILKAVNYGGYFYLLLLTAIYGLTYVGLYYLYPLFFTQKIIPLTKSSWISIGWIIGLSLAVYVVSNTIPSIALGNRVLHTFGGGFLALLTCFLVVRDTKLEISRLQFFIISFAVVTTLGVGNELLEFFFQNVTTIVFADTISDTWLDLVSNTVGILLASAVLLPLLGKKKQPARELVFTEAAEI
jgi:hypothetical protein